MGRFFTVSYFASTASFVSARIQSKRRITVSGRITSPYSWGLYTPVNLSAIAQIRAAFSLTWALRLIFCFLHRQPLYPFGIFRKTFLEFQVCFVGLFPCDS